MDQKSHELVGVTGDGIKDCATRLLRALEALDRGCHSPGFRGVQNGSGEEVGNEIQDALEALARRVGYAT